MFVPQKKTLEKYASVLIDFALNNGKGVKKGEVVNLSFGISAMPLALEIYRKILERGAHAVIKINEEKLKKILLNKGNDSQLSFFPKKYFQSLVDIIDHRVSIISNRNPLILKEINPRKIVKFNKSRQIIRRLMSKKEDEGKFGWTVALYGTPKMAKEAKLNIREYWDEIEKACFLDDNNPLEKWKKVFQDLKKIKKKLNSLPIKEIHLTAKDTNLRIGIGEKRKWVSGGGYNIPSFEIFTSPDWRLINGKIYFDFPLYCYGSLIEDIYLEFKNGIVIKSKARKNEKLLKEIIKQKNADKVGEFSLTDKRFSKINHFMASTLYDENFGGKWGNTHLALGSSFHDAYKGNAKKVKKTQWRRMGFNQSLEHKDIIAKQDRIVQATLKNGIAKTIYRDGQFVS